MRGHKGTLANFVGLLAVTLLTASSAGIASAQTSLASADKQKTETDSTQASRGVVSDKPPTIRAGSEPKSAANPVAAEAALMNARDESPKNGAATKPSSSPTPPPPCQRIIQADIVALPQPIMLNRLGAAIPDGLVFALKSDTVATGSGVTTQYQLKPRKRPRPLVLRANVGDCLHITLTNGIPIEKFTGTPAKPAMLSTGTTEVSLHIQGMEWQTGPGDDGSYVGTNKSSLASAPPPPAPTPSPMPPNTQTYHLFAREEGTFMMYTMGDTSTLGDQLTRGLFGALNVQPAGAEWYRSQVSADDLALATYNANRSDQVPPGSLVCNPAGSSNCTFTINGKSVKVIKTPDFGTGPGATKGGYLQTLDHHPLMNYAALYPAKRLDGTDIPSDLVGTPILQMFQKDPTDPSGKTFKIVHTDLTAIITGPNAGRFPGTTGVDKPEPACNAENNPALNPPPGGKVDPLFCANPAAPDRKQPYRELTIMYHGALFPIAQQAFPVFTDSNMEATLVAGQDAFAINYGTGGIGAEVYANRIGVGPMGDCIDCKFEEFFLSAWSVGDPAMLVDRPANTNLQPAKPFPGPFPAAPVQPLVPPPPKLCTAQQLGDNNPPTPPDKNCANARTPGNGFPYTLVGLPKATRAYYPDDPSNVYHSYINDHVKFRILHDGRDVTHVHHQHAHQWLQSPNSDEASYLDSQMISPGASYTLEMVYNGSGNRNKVVGDSIFHCHFYPHFAAGMWAMWRTHDVFESGTFVYPQGTEVLIQGVMQDVSNQPVLGSRALPDGEIIAGVPTPAIVPLPTLPMAPLPGYAQIQNNVTVDGSPTPIPYGGQVVIGGKCLANKINGLDVIGGCADGVTVNGEVIDSQYDFAKIKMVGEFQPSDCTKKDPISGKCVEYKLENPGYPYFIPGIAGSRSPHPPLDFARDASGVLDGGLPRHVVAGGSVKFEKHNQTDWSKDLATMNALQLPEEGTAVEQAAMAYFGQKCYPTFFPDGTPGSCPSSLSTIPQTTLTTPPTGFRLNGLPRKNPAGNSAEKLGAQPGAPFADPAVDDNGNPTGTLRRYKAAAIQMDVTLNKQGWHFPQQRMLTLWNDVSPTIAKTRKPEPLFFRGNSGDIIEYWHTNLVPNYYELDDFQVRTPTDILGQHIHLVKFDVTSSDGAGNGFNYEDGTFSPEEVQDIIEAINASPSNGFVNAPNQSLKATLPPKEILDCAANPGDPRCQAPTAGCTPKTQPKCQSWLGAQTTIQRWYLDPQVDDSYPNRSADGSYGVDRTLRTVFTHDHFGPSTHQQAGLYAGLLVEPTGSTWTSNDGATLFGSRPDGGPTSWQARIITKNTSDSYREFMLEFQDLQLAYQLVGATETPLNPPSTPNLITTGLNPGAQPGTQSVNYTNELIDSRLAPQNLFPPPSTSSDLSYLFDNLTAQATNPSKDADPFTPLMRAYQNDKVQVRMLVGAHVFAHQFYFEGPTWLAEPSWKNSGYRSIQAMGLSEHFEFLFNVPPSSLSRSDRKECPPSMPTATCKEFLKNPGFTDYRYSPSFDQQGLANGMWGLFRSYDPTGKASSLAPLPNNPIGNAPKTVYATCPATLKAPGVKRVFNITAVTAQKALSVRSPMAGTTKGQIVLNDRGNSIDQLAVISGQPSTFDMLTTGIMYVRSEDLEANGLLRKNVPIEPLILRANAGDCIQVNLTNKIDPSGADLYAQNFFMSAPFNHPPFPTKSSRYVGLHPQLLALDASQSYGINVGWNRWNSQGQKDQDIPFNQTTTYTWYAGKVGRDGKTGAMTYTPIEYGPLNLLPSDPLFQNINGLFGEMIIEPAGSSWKCGEAANLANCDPPAAPAPPVTPPTSRASATVTTANGPFREFAVMISDAMLSYTNNKDRRVLAQGAINYRTEPFPVVTNAPPAPPWSFRYQNNKTNDFSCMASNNLIYKPYSPTPPQPPSLGDPRTPIFTAEVGDNVRFRFAHPFGTGASQVITVHGHVWQRNPYTNESRVIGSNLLSQWMGSRDNHGSGDHFDIVIDKAGGQAGRAGDYLYIGFVPNQAVEGAWGLFRVGHVNDTGTLPPNAACSQVLPPAYTTPPKNEDLQRFLRAPITTVPPKP